MLDRGTSLWRGEELREQVVCLAMLALFVGSVIYVFPFTVDDAFIVARYARNLAAGRGYAMNPGAWTDGVTGPLWLLPGIVAAKVWAPVLAVQKAAGAVLVGAGAWCALPRRAPPWGRALYCAVLAAQASLTVWAVAGLETGAAFLAIALLVRGVTTGGRRLAAVAACVVPALRPELVPAAAVLAVAVATGDGVHDDARQRWLPVVALVGGLVTVAAFRAALFGSPLPLAMIAKPSAPGVGVQYVVFGALLMTGGTGAWALVRARAMSREARWLGAAVGVHVVVVAVAGGDWMPGFRLLVPILPAYAWVLGMALCASPVGLGRMGGDRLRPLLLCVAVLVPALDASVEWPRARAAGLLADERSGPLADWLGARAKSVAMVDVGRLPWLTDVTVLDLGGVTDPVIAHAPGGHLGKQLDVAYIDAHRPDVVLLHSTTRPTFDEAGNIIAFGAYPVEQNLARLPWFQAHFTVVRIFEWAPDYFYVAYLRTEPTAP